MLHNSLLTNSSTTYENLPLLKTRKTQDNTKQRRPKRMFSKMLYSDINYTKLENLLKFGRFYHLISFVVSAGIVSTTNNVHVNFP